jgi:hypothetical protein
MREIHINEIKAVLNELLDKKISREDASDWALKLRESWDNKNLKFIPEEFEQIIWKSILFIEGIDLRDAPNCYLHNDQDIQRVLQKL